MDRFGDAVRIDWTHNLGWWILVIMFAFSLLLPVGLAGYYEVEGRVKAQEQIQAGEMRIGAYNHFFDLYVSIKSYNYALVAFHTQLSQVTDGQEGNRILANIASVTAQKARLIQQYNADARKTYTIDQFRDWQLPYQIEEK